MLDRLLRRLFRRNKDELLRVLDRPEIPLNTNASENDIRTLVTKRKISGGTVSHNGRDARDTMLGPAKTCRKLKLSFYEYLGSRLGMIGTQIPPLAELIRPRPFLTPPSSPGNLPRLLFSSFSRIARASRSDLERAPYGLRAVASGNCNCPSSIIRDARTAPFAPAIMRIGQLGVRLVDGLA